MSRFLAYRIYVAVPVSLIGWDFVKSD